MNSMFKILFISGCVGEGGETQLYVPANILECGARYLSTTC